MNQLVSLANQQQQSDKHYSTLVESRDATSFDYDHHLKPFAVNSENLTRRKNILMFIFSTGTKTVQLASLKKSKRHSRPYFIATLYYFLYI